MRTSLAGRLLAGLVLACVAGPIAPAGAGDASPAPVAPSRPAPPPDPSVPAPPLPAPPPPPAVPAPGSTSAASVPPGLLLGKFTLPPDPVTDGDTIRLPAGAPAKSVRVACVDAEEVWHKGEEADRAAAEQDFDAYAKAKRGDAATPRKFGTPAGEAAKAFAEELFRGVTAVRLERDEPGRDFDGYGRVLAHVFLAKDGRDVLMGEALVRAGWSPYFVKYGRSRRFDARFEAAQAEARAARRGIWGDAVKHYPDYADRLVWWESRAKQVDAWREDVAKAKDSSTMIELGVPGETARLEGLLGRTVTVFGSLDHEITDRPPKRILLVDRPDAPFPVVVFDPKVWAAIDHPSVQAAFVRVTGVLTEFRGRPQIKIEDPSAISTR